MQNPILRLAAAALLTISVAAHSAPANRVVLPDAVIPEHYRIDFTPDIDKLTFKGTVEIDLTVKRATDRIVLNAADLVIDEASLSGEAKAPAIGYDDEVQTATFTFDHPLGTGAHTLRLAYHGTIYQSASGLFALEYQGTRGKQHALFTQFENSDARRFVPCWDEPGLKATFVLSATMPAGLMPLSNMPVAATKATPAGRHVTFAKSPKMSTYLLFFGAGDFERVHRDVQGVDVGIVVKRGDTASAAFALDAAAQLLPYYNDYFGVPYPLPKLDLVAGPGASQFFGAMENWGAIFYFEKYLLIDSRLSTQADRQDVYNVVAHEMAHQWFGDLVTMAWWDDLWLNEGFATWMANKATDHFNPDWKVWLQSQFPKQGVMQRDARDGTHPVITTIEDVAQAANAFDDITYEKGAAVLRTLENHVGEAAFRDGVRRYMHDHQYGNTVTDELWAEIAKASPDSGVTRIAHDFTLQSGVPMVNLLSATCTGGKTRLSLSQTRYVIDAGSSTSRTWHLPVKVATLGSPSSDLLVSGETPASFDIAGCGAVILNAGQGGYLRSRYSHDGLAAVVAKFGELTPDDQFGVLNDTLALAYSAGLGMSDYLDITRRFPADTDPVVATSLLGQLVELDRLYGGLATQNAFRRYARGVLNPFFSRLGWEASPGESANITILRSRLITLLGRFGDPDVIGEARKRFGQLQKNPAAFGSDSRRTVLDVVAMNADQSDWDKLRQMSKSAASELERKEMIELLGKPQSDALAQQALNLVFSGDLPPTLAPEIVDAVSGRHPEMALDFAIAHWDALSTLLEAGSANQFVPSLTVNSSDPKTIEKLDAFARSHVPANARQDYVLASARVRCWAKIRATRLPEADRWIAAQVH